MWMQVAFRNIPQSLAEDRFERNAVLGRVFGSVGANTPSNTFGLDPIETHEQPVTHDHAA